MNEQAALAFVKSTAQALALPLDEARAIRVAQILSRTAQMATALDQIYLGPEQEIAEVYRPAPFPRADADAQTRAA